MTRPDHDIALEEHFDSYQKLLRERAWYSAAVSLAEIFHGSAGLTANKRAAWNSRLRQELNEDFLREVRSGQEQSIERIRRILSVGSEWTGEEILLLMLMRINVKLLSDFLGHAVAVEPMEHLDQIDDQLATLAESKKHARHFRWALNRMKKTAPFDVEAVWLSLINS